MTSLLEAIEQLTEEERRQVERFTESLLAHRRPDPVHPDHKISFDGWAGCMADIHPEMSDQEFKQLIRDEWVRAAED